MRRLHQYGAVEDEPSSDAGGLDIAGRVNVLVCPDCPIVRLSHGIPDSRRVSRSPSHGCSGSNPAASPLDANFFRSRRILLLLPIPSRREAFSELTLGVFLPTPSLVTHSPPGRVVWNYDER